MSYPSLPPIVTGPSSLALIVLTSTVCLVVLLTAIVLAHAALRQEDPGPAALYLLDLVRLLLSRHGPNGPNSPFGPSLGGVGVRRSGGEQGGDVAAGGDPGPQMRVDVAGEGE